MNKLILSIVLILLSITAGFAQDAEGCKDHQFFSRTPNFFITGCSQNFNKLEYYVSDEVTDSKEGNLKVISYSFPDDISLKMRVSYRF